jgi:hypothetical protein
MGTTGEPADWNDAVADTLALAGAELSNDRQGMAVIMRHADRDAVFTMLKLLARLIAEADPDEDHLREWARQVAGSL